MPTKIRKAVIPAAGLGTRFLPATKTIPKEMFPIVDRPILLHIFEEIATAGLDEVVLVLGPTKGAIEAFFRDFRDLKVTFARQENPRGLGHAVLCAKEAVGDEPFAVLLGDEIMLTRPGRSPAIAQLCQSFEKTGISSVAVMEVPERDVVKYGIVDARPAGPGLWNVVNLVEKPDIAHAPSRLALPGRYVFDAEIFRFLHDAKPGRNGEIQLTDAMASLARERGMVALKLEADRFDAGDKLGFMQVNLELGLRHPEIGPQLEQYLKDRFGGKS